MKNLMVAKELVRIARELVARDTAMVLVNQEKSPDGAAHFNAVLKKSGNKVEFDFGADKDKAKKFREALGKVIREFAV